MIDGQGSVWWNDLPTYNPTDETADNSSEESVINYSNSLCQAKTRPANTFN